MKLAECKVQSITPYSQGRYYEVEKLPKELHKDYEIRTWRERCHYRSDGHLFIPPMAFVNSLKEAAKYLSIPIPGKNKQTYTKHFEAGVMASEPLILPETKDKVEGEWLFVPSNGQRGGGSRVPKCFPIIREWAGVMNFIILDDIITQDIFKQVIDTAGNLIGIGRFRPRNMGYYGRYKVTEINWIDK